jgi:hypothetical protein
MLTYTLTPTSMVVAANQSGQQNVVINVMWEYTATDGIYIANSGPGNTQVTYTSGNPFTPYANLTEAQVAGWVLGAWTPDQTASYQKQLSDSIAAQQAAQYATPPLPWS